MNKGILVDVNTEEDVVVPADTLGDVPMLNDIPASPVLPELHPAVTDLAVNILTPQAERPANIYIPGDRVSVAVIGMTGILSVEATVLKIARYAGPGDLASKLIYLVDTGKDIGVAVTKQDVMDDKSAMVGDVNAFTDLTEGLIVVQHHTYRGTKALPKQFVINKLWKFFDKSTISTRL